VHAAVGYECGQLLADRFSLVRLLGRGAMCDVWLAEDLHLHSEPVAVKMLNARINHDRNAIADLKREVLLARRLRHPSVVGVYTFWQGNADCFITMEYVDGNNLSEALSRRSAPFAVEQVLSWVCALCSALDYAHSCGVLHRDVKPANLLLDREGQVHLADFGIARTMDELRQRFTGYLAGGTLMYMSPEQLSGGETDSRSDLYSLACTVYELLHGVPPFYDGSIVTQIQLQDAEPIPHLGRNMNDVLLKALSKDPRRRYPRCEDFYEALTAAAAKAPRASHSPAPDLEERRKAIARSMKETVPLVPLDQRRRTLRLGSILINEGLITRAQLNQALGRQRTSGRRLGEILIQAGWIEEEPMARALGRQLEVPFVALRAENADRTAAQMISAETAEKYRCLPIGFEAGHIVLAMADPLDFEAIVVVEERTGMTVDVCIAAESAICKTIKQFNGR
jgi:serine/threonine protein kinase